MCVHSFPLKPCECFTQSLSSFLVDSHLESLLLCFPYNYIPSDCSGLNGFLCLLYICFYGILHLFFLHMPILKYPTKHVPITRVFVFGGDMHPCSYGNWFFFSRKLSYFLQWCWRGLSMTISCNIFYRTATLGIINE